MARNIYNKSLVTNYNMKNLKTDFGFIDFINFY